MILTGDKSKQSCRAKSQYALKKGIITKPDNCSVCNSLDSNLYKHHKDYSDPFNIVWMCKTCHDEHHAANPAISAPAVNGREFRGGAKRNYSMPAVVRDKLAANNDTLKDWCKRRRLHLNVVYNLFSGATLGLYGESCRAKRYLDMHFRGWDIGINQIQTDTHEHLKFQKHEQFCDILKTKTVSSATLKMKTPRKLACARSSAG